MVEQEVAGVSFILIFVSFVGLKLGNCNGYKGCLINNDDLLTNLMNRLLTFCVRRGYFIFRYAKINVHQHYAH